MILLPRVGAWRVMLYSGACPRCGPEAEGRDLSFLAELGTVTGFRFAPRFSEFRLPRTGQLMRCSLCLVGCTMVKSSVCRTVVVARRPSLDHLSDFQGRESRRSWIGGGLLCIVLVPNYQPTASGIGIKCCSTFCVLRPHGYVRRLPGSYVFCFLLCRPV